MTMELPTLSSGGFIHDPAVKLEKIVAYFFIADYSQSNQHRGRVASLPYLIKNHGHEPSILVDRIQSTLEGMLGAYFDTCYVNVSQEDPLTSKPEYNIIVDGTVSQGGKKYDISRLLTISNNTLASVSELQIK